MSHLRDIQKLRLARNSNNTQLAFNHRLSQNSPDINIINQYNNNSNVQFNHNNNDFNALGLNNIQRFRQKNQQRFNQVDSLNLQQNQGNLKYFQSKQFLPKTVQRQRQKKQKYQKQLQSQNQRRLSHKRGSSNGATFYQKKQADMFNVFGHGNSLNIHFNNLNINGNNGLSLFNMSTKLTNNPLKGTNILSSRKSSMNKQRQIQNQYFENNQSQKNQLQLQKYLDFDTGFEMSQKKSFVHNGHPLISNRNINQSSKSIQKEKGQRERNQRLDQPQIISRSNFEILYPIGKGGFGKVWKVQQKKSNQIYALKEMYKSKIINKKSINSVLNERKILSKLNHNFIINIHYSFQDRQNLYLVMDYLDGGDLRYHIGKRGKFTEIQSKFFIANLILGLQYIHKNNIIHRDIKPQNLVLESNGYLRITDMGISRQMRQQNNQDTSGTPGYMAPEVMVRKNHGFQVDYFAIGVMGYQFMLGKRPYVGKNRKQIRDQILAKQAGIRMEDLPKKWSIQAADFINRLLIRNPKNRLGSNGISELKLHPWLKEFDWRKLQSKKIKAPYIPLSIQDDYEQYKQQISEDTIDQNIEQNLLMLRDKQVQSLFEGYQYDKYSLVGKNIHISTQEKQRQKDSKPRSTSYTTNCTQPEIKQGGNLTVRQIKQLRQLRSRRESQSQRQRLIEKERIQRQRQKDYAFNDQIQQSQYYQKQRR